MWSVCRRPSCTSGPRLGDLGALEAMTRYRRPTGVDPRGGMR